MSTSESSNNHAACQHYVVCSTTGCEQNCQFYCKQCHQQLCDICRDEHIKNTSTKDHEIVPYRLRQCQHPVEKCKLHPLQNLDTFCRECKLPLCSKCSTMEERNGHEMADLEDLYKEKYAFCQDKIDLIREYLLPSAQSLKTNINEDATGIKNVMESFRKSMQAEAESLKSLVDEVTSENIEQSHTIEKSLLKLCDSQEQSNDDNIVSLQKVNGQLYSCLATSSLTFFFSLMSEHMDIPNIQEKLNLVPPTFTAGACCKDDVKNLLGRLYVPCPESENNEQKQTDKGSTPENFTKRGLKHDKNLMKQTFSMFSFVVMIKEYKLPGIIRICHLSLNKFGRLWVSDLKGNLVQTDLKDNQILSIQTNGKCAGYHTVMQDGSLIYADRVKKVINRVTTKNKITKFIKTRDWEPLSVHSSHINGDILIGMIKGKEAKIIRYNKIGKDIQAIHEDNNGRPLFSQPHYITENINGDVCISDLNKQAIVVVNIAGQHRFSYKGQKPEFYFWGVCTDVLGNILACESISEEVHLLNQDGVFLGILLSSRQHGVMYPRSVCVDDENNLYVGKGNNNTLQVYKYLM